MPPGVRWASRLLERVSLMPLRIGMFVCICGSVCKRVMSKWEIDCLLLRGCVEWNPGPRFPCGGCSKEVSKGLSIACSMCGVWWHSKCSGLDGRVIRRMSASHNWVCRKCSNVALLNVEAPGDFVADDDESVCRVKDECLVKRNGAVRVKRTSRPHFPCGGCCKEVGAKGYSVACSVCSVWWHRACAGLSVKFICSLSVSHEWVCLNCSRADVMPKLYESCDDKRDICAVCAVARRVNLSGLRCVDCNVWVHKGCCGLNRWQRDRATSWRCSVCVNNGGDVSGVGVGIVADAVGMVAPLPTAESGTGNVVEGGTNVGGLNVSVRSVRNDGVRHKCGGCGTLVRSGHGICCVVCGSVWHLKCAFASRGQADRACRNDWTCTFCYEERNKRSDGRDVGAYLNSGVSDCDRISGLRMVQWNIDHLLAKIPELEVWLMKNRIDVACLQETKLRAEYGSVRVRGYDVVRKDRLRSGVNEGRGGGLVCLIRSDWSYKEFDCGVDPLSGLEVLGVDVFDSDKNVWHVVNVYVPPVNSMNVDLDVIDRLPGMNVG